MKYGREYYDNLYLTAQGGTLDVFLRAMEWLPENPIIVDLGCGDGAFAKTLKSVNQYIGYDFSGVAIDRAKTLNLGNQYSFHCADIVTDTLEIPDGAIVTCFQTMEHLCLPDGDIKLIKRLPIKTRFIFSVPIKSLGGSHLRAYEHINHAEAMYGQYLKFDQKDKVELLHRGKEPRKNNKRSFRYVYDTEKRGT
jgi:SAM-dependent methyltransferase